jgi:outer membrane lipoprotein-sorting protein
MRIFESRPALRWLVPTIVVGVIGGTSLIAATAIAGPSLPDRSPQQLLVDLQQADVDDFSGTVVQTSNLGLPELPGIGGGQYDTSLTSLISGTHTLQVWSSGETKQRLAIHGTLGETDVIRNGNDLWHWSSRDNAATHRTLSADDHGHDRNSDEPLPSDAPKTPQEAADRAIAAIEPTTTVTVDPAETVAGRPAYALVLTPKGDGSLIGQVRIAVDGEKKVPLSVEVIATDGTVVFDTTFRSIDFSQPDDAYFTFNPPPGTKVTEEKAPTASRSDGAQRKAEQKAAAQDEPEVVGKGWSAVMIGKVDPSELSSADDSRSQRHDEGASIQQILNALPRVSGAWGSGRLLSSKAFTVVITDDGRIAGGAVAPATVYEALS